MPPQLERHPESNQPHVPSLGFTRRKAKPAWRETVTSHVPEPWPAARLALQARIAALDIEA